MKQAEVTIRWAGLVQDGFLSDDSYERRRRYQKSLSYLPDSSDMCILEVGSGPGLFNKALIGAGYSRVIGSDITWDHVVLARKNSPAGKFIVANGERLPFADGLFDIIVSNAAIEHFMDPALGISEMARMLRPGGVAVITSDCYIWRVFQVLGLYKSKMPVDRAMTFGRFKWMFTQAGLVLNDFEGWGVTHYLRRLEKVLPFVRSLRTQVEADQHWANRKSRNRLINWCRTFILDENLFALQKPGEWQGPAWTDFSEIIPKQLICPTCGNSSLSFCEVEDSLDCSKCNRSFPVRDGIPILTMDQPKDGERNSHGCGN